jgi:16S rRNA (uracil1498-N3)-methyltransferase
MNRLFVTPAALDAGGQGEIVVRGGDASYLARVLRLGAGDEVTLFDGGGREAPAKIVHATVEAVTLALCGAIVRAPSAALSITLVVGLLKGEKMELVIQKATELGVAAIVPARCEHAVVQLTGDRADARVERWQKIAREAARQCGRADAPTIAPVADFADTLLAGEQALRLLFHEGAQGSSLRAALPEQARSVIVAVGPEGGFAPAEVDDARTAGFRIVGFGPRVLRAETAAIAAIAVLAFALGDLA